MPPPQSSKKSHAMSISEALLFSSQTFETTQSSKKKKKTDSREKAEYNADSFSSDWLASVGWVEDLANGIDPSLSPSLTLIDPSVAQSASSQPTCTYTPTSTNRACTEPENNDDGSDGNEVSTMSNQQLPHLSQHLQQHHALPQIDPRLGAAPYSGHPSTPATNLHHPHPQQPHPQQHQHQHPHHAYGRPYQYGEPPGPSAPAQPQHRQSSLKMEAPAPPTSIYGSNSSAQQSPQPYYYPTPPNPAVIVNTPIAASTGTASNHPSPDDTRVPSGHTVTYAPDQQNESHSTSPNDSHNVDGGDDAKRPRACEACRGLKVRCDQDPARPDIPCKRCAKAGRQCVITQPSRKRQKKSDSRVAELEKKLDALTAALNQQQRSGVMPGANFGTPSADVAQQQNQPQPQPQPQPPMAMNEPATNQSLQWSAAQQEEQAAEGPLRKRRKTEEDDTDTPALDVADANGSASISRNSSAQDPKHPQYPVPDEMHQPWSSRIDLKRCLHQTTPAEFVARVNSLVSPELAEVVFGRYKAKLSAQLPAVVFPSDLTAAQLFKDKPILYVCVLSASSYGALHPDVAQELAKEAMGCLADCIVRCGAKSLELIQAMQVIALWYKPPEQAEQTNFYQIIHMSAIMALDIGLGKRYNPVKARRSLNIPGANYTSGIGQKTIPQDSDTMEARRAWLGCYYLSASASMVLRRPNLIRWTHYMEECIKVLETSPDAASTDKLFCQHVKIQHICEDIGLQFLMDDNTANISLTDPGVTYALNVLENQLKTWKAQVPDDLKDLPGLRFFEHVTSLYLHEIALHFNHNVEDFRVPFTEESLKTVNNTSDTLNQQQIAALEACLRAAHGILDTMLSFDLQTIKSLPLLLYFVRCVYAIVILVKMHVAVCTPGSELGKMMRPGDLKVEQYLDGLLEMFAKVSQESPMNRHPKVLRILYMLRDWFSKHKDGFSNGHGKRNARKHAKIHASGDGEGQHVRQKQQTPLQLLSQVATGNGHHHQQQKPQRQEKMPVRDGRPNDNTQDWTYTSPVPITYPQHQQQPHHPSQQPDRRHSAQNSASPNAMSHAIAAGQHQQPQHQMHHTSPVANMSYAHPYAVAPNDGSGMLMDPVNDYGWGSGFEQAMDIALGGMDAMQGSAGLDGWFLGDGTAPFGYDAPGGGGGGGPAWQG